MIVNIEFVFLIEASISQINKHFSEHFQLTGLFPYMYYTMNNKKELLLNYITNKINGTMSTFLYAFLVSFVYFMILKTGANQNQNMCFILAYSTNIWDKRLNRVESLTDYYKLSSKPGISNRTKTKPCVIQTNKKS
jgi:predicted PurR-regulated permease PerM